MMNKKRMIIFLFGFAIILTTGLLNAYGQEKKVELKDKQITVQMADKPLFSVFARLIYKYDIAIGFEESSLDKNHNDYDFETNVPPDEEMQRYANKTLTSDSGTVVENHLITVKFKDTRLEDVMDAIVKQMQNYDWEINNDVVNIFPIRGRDSKFKKLLDLRIREFVIWKDAEVGTIQQLLYRLPEFKPFLEENDLQANSVRTQSLWFIERPLPVEMKFSDLTFKDLLNKITKSKRGGWILRRTKDSNPKYKEFFEILI